MKRASTSIWSIVETMQQSLEKQGLDPTAVDAAVTHRIAALLGGVAASVNHRNSALELMVAAPAKA